MHYKNLCHGYALNIPLFSLPPPKITFVCFSVWRNDDNLKNVLFPILARLLVPTKATAYGMESVLRIQLRGKTKIAPTTVQQKSWISRDKNYSPNTVHTWWPTAEMASKPVATQNSCKLLTPTSSSLPISSRDVTVVSIILSNIFVSSRAVRTKALSSMLPKWSLLQLPKTNVSTIAPVCQHFSFSFWILLRRRGQKKPFDIQPEGSDLFSHIDRAISLLSFEFHSVKEFQMPATYLNAVSIRYRVAYFLHDKQRAEFHDPTLQCSKL